MPYKKDYNAKTMKGDITGYTPSTNGSQGTSASIPLGQHHQKKDTPHNVHPGGMKRGNVKGKFNHGKD